MSGQPEPELRAMPDPPEIRLYRRVDVGPIHTWLMTGDRLATFLLDDGNRVVGRVIRFSTEEHDRGPDVVHILLEP